MTVVVVVVAVTPVPERGIVSEEFEALLVMTKLPVADPADFGANVTVKVVLWLADKVSGKVGPLRLNPVPDMEAWEILTLLGPGLVTVIFCVLLAPTVTFPKFRLVGLAERVELDCEDDETDGLLYVMSSIARSMPAVNETVTVVEALVHPVVTNCIEPVVIACDFVCPRLSVSVRVPLTSVRACKLTRSIGPGEKVNCREVTCEEK